MKANLEYLVKAIRARLNENKIEVHVYVNDEDIDDVRGANIYYDDVQIAVMDCSVPTIADMQTIARAFFENPNQVFNVQSGWGFVEFFVSDGVFKESVDVETLRSAMSEKAFETMLK